MKGLNQEESLKRYKELLREAGFSGSFNKANLKAFGNKKELELERAELNLANIVATQGRPRRSTRSNASYNLESKFKEVEEALREELGLDIDSDNDGDEEEEEEEQAQEGEEIHSDDEDRGKRKKTENRRHVK